MYDPSYLKKDKFEVPPDREDWLWWKPDEPEDTCQTGWSRRFDCDPCEVKWEQQVSRSLPVRCFCCGRFKRKPKI